MRSDRYTAVLAGLIAGWVAAHPATAHGPTQPLGDAPSGLPVPPCAETAGFPLSGQPKRLVSEFHSHGWWQSGPPSFEGPVAFLASRLPIQSPACERPEHLGTPAELPGWLAARERCRQRGYEGVHLYVSFGADGGNDLVDNMAAEDPWSRDSVTAGNVRVVQASSIEELRRAVRRLTDSCKVIRYAFIDSHGSPGVLEAGSSGTYPVSHLLSTGVGLCSLGTRPSLQFSGCRVACREVAERLQADLEYLVRDSAYQPPANPEPFLGTRLLFNPENGEIRPGLSIGPFHPVSTEVTVIGGVALELTVGVGGAVLPDLPTERLPACPALSDIGS